jgi:hypothetical protein
MCHWRILMLLMLYDLLVDLGERRNPVWRRTPSFTRYCFQHSRKHSTNHLIRLMAPIVIPFLLWKVLTLHNQDAIK